MHGINKTTINELTSSISFAVSCNTNSLAGTPNSDIFTLLGGDTNIGGNSFTSNTVIITRAVVFSAGVAAVLVPTTVIL